MSVFLQIGTDCEFFVKDEEHNISSAIGLIGGSKEDPLIVSGGNLQEDNVLAEMATNPVRTLDEWLLCIQDVRGDLEDKIKPFTLECQSSYVYTKEQLMSYPDEALILGCTPDFNVYKGKNNPSPNPKQGLRTAAGHVHFSYVRPNNSATISIVKALDYTLGLWSVITDDDKERRKLYGKAGCVRFKDYGGEYRTLGNFWLRNTIRQTFVYNITKMCVEHHAVMLPMLRAIVNEEDLQAIINDCDRDRAMTLFPAISDIIVNLRGERHANAA